MSENKQAKKYFENMPYGEKSKSSEVHGKQNQFVINKFVDVYINGNLKRRHKLRSIPVQNYGDVFVNHYNGFPGLISNLQYFNYALPIWKIEQEMNSGPSSIPVADQPSGDYNYLAHDYWLQGN